MLVNPDIEAWFDKLQGRPLGSGGSAPRGVPQNYAAAAAQGIIKPASGMFGFTAPGINAERFQPRPPAPYPAQREPSGIPAPFTPMSGGGGDLGGAAKAAGLEKLGKGAMDALQAMKARQQALEAINGGYTPLRALDGPLSQQMARNPGATMTNIPPPSPYSPPPVGASSDIPLAAQAGAEGTQPVPPIGGAYSASPGGLPTFAQGGGTQTAGPGAIGGNIAAARFNNPGNVSLPIAGWNGGGQIVGISGQPGYANFPDMQTGMNAFQQRVNNYIDSRGLNTIGALNSVYAKDPKWGAGVASASGLGLNTPLDTSNPDQMRALQKGILTQEIGPKNAASVLSGQSGPPPLTSPSASAYAAASPNLNGPPESQLAGPSPAQNTGGPSLISPGQPQTGPAYSNDTWNNRPQYDYGGGQQAPAPIPPPRPQDMPSPQGMNDQGMNPLAAALANGPDQTPQLDQSAMLAMALSQPEFGSTPDFGSMPDFGASSDFSMPDFGGGFFGGLFG